MKNIVVIIVLNIILFLVVIYILDGIYRDYHKERYGVELTPILIEMLKGDSNGTK